MAKYLVVKEVVQSIQVEVEADSLELARTKASMGQHRPGVPVVGRQAGTVLNPASWPAIEKEKAGGLFCKRWPSEPPPKPEVAVRRTAA